MLSVPLVTAYNVDVFKRKSDACWIPTSHAFLHFKSALYPQAHIAVWMFGLLLYPIVWTVWWSFRSFRPTYQLQLYESIIPQLGSDYFHSPTFISKRIEHGTLASVMRCQCSQTAIREGPSIPRQHDASSKSTSNIPRGKLKGLKIAEFCKRKKQQKNDSSKAGIPSGAAADYLTVAGVVVVIILSNFGPIFGKANRIGPKPTVRLQATELHTSSPKHIIYQVTANVNAQWHLGEWKHTKKSKTS